MSATTPARPRLNLRAMRKSLRFRLLVSYVLLLGVTIVAITMTLFFATAARQAPPQQTYERLTALVRGLDFSSLIVEFGNLREADLPRPAQAGEDSSAAERERLRLADLAALETRYVEMLTEFASTRDVRVMWLVQTNDGTVRVAYDSSGLTQRGDTMPEETLSVQRGSPGGERSTLRLPDGAEQVYGVLRDDLGQQWLFSGFATAFLRPIARTNLVMVAEKRPTESLQDVLADFGVALLLPLIQAGLVGLVVAALLATLISRTIARPLQAVSRAATAVARGDMDQRVPISGPQEVQQVARAFNYMNDEVQAAQQSQRDFMANVSHDLKTPLTSIQGYSQAIMDGTARQPEKAAAIIHDEASRLTRMVIALTDLARMEAGQFSLNIASLDLAQIVEAVGQKLQPLAQKKHITFQVEAPSQQRVAGDGDRLVQVFNNLIGNAIKYTPQGGRVRVRCRAVETGVEVLISDNGPGIPKADLPRIFERFYQVDKARGPRRGTGLGLAITHEIVMLHGGRIDVQSIEGQGTQFTVWLPFDYTADTVTIRRR